MTAIADQSTMPVWPAWVWALILAAMAAVCVAASINHHGRNHRRRTNYGAGAVTTRQPVEYEASPYGPMRAPRTDLCHIEGCGQTCTTTIAGWQLCTDCRNEMEARWGLENPDPIAVIENYANTGDAA